MYARTPREVMLLLGADLQSGLTSEEAERRLHHFGPNTVPEPERGGRLQRLGRQLASPLILILLACAAISATLGNGIDAGVILAVVIMNAIVGYAQESKAEAELAALRELSRTTADIIRDGVRRTLPSEDVVPGDLILLGAGDKVPADIRLLASASAALDESALTGESLPVAKETEALPRDTALADRINMAYAGTLVTAGSATGVAVATGGDTELGGIHRLVGGVDPLQTPLTRQISRFSIWLTLAIGLLAVATFVIGIGRGESASEMFSAAIALAVGAIPEGLPAAVTITLAIGVGRMARKNAVVRALPSVETLGSTTVICTDKTGTLTQNRMTVRRVITAHGTFAPGQPGDRSGLAALRAGALCNDADARRADGTWVTTGDPTESALVVAAAEAGIDVDATRGGHPRVATIPFDASRRTMSTIHASPQGPISILKGSFEQVLPECAWQLSSEGNPEPISHAQISERAESAAAEGFRVIAIAEAAADDTGQVIGPYTFLGLEALQDPPRPSAIAAVSACRSAGIRVKMITGDHPATAAAIAAEVGIDPSDVYARVTPEEKLELVRSLQAAGEVVAMTGDGVNDAPALRQADIGVAMGLAGTDVAKEASDLVLLDDDFATVESAVEEGRGVFENLTKFIVWTLPTNMAEGLIIVAAVVAGSTLPILPVQILWINMTTAVFLGLMLAFEPKEPGLMRRPPRDPHSSIMTTDLIVRVLLVSALLIAGAWWLFEHELGLGASEAQARTAAMNVFVAVEAIYLFSCRSLSKSAWQVGFFSNPWLWLGLSGQIIGQLAITYMPVMNRIFSTAPIPASTWGWILLVCIACSLVVTLHKMTGTRARIGANR